MKSLFKKYIQSVSSPEEFERFSKYINNDRNTEAIYKLMKGEWSRELQSEEANQKNPILLQKIQQKILTEEIKKSDRKLRVYSQFSRIAALIIIGLVLSGVWFWQPNNSTNRVAMQTISIPYGAKTQFQLPDGSSVWLNSGSTLTYSNNFSKQRRVELKGEAFFDVVKNKKKFVVETNSGEIEVLGTAFNVEAYGVNEFTTTLERGMVKVVNTKDKQSLLMKPGEQIQLIHHRFTKSKVETELFTSWKDGKLIFSRDPFPNIMKRLERWFNVKIEYAESDFNGLWFSGTIENETVTEVLEMICKTAPVTYTYNSKNREVTIKSREN